MESIWISFVPVMIALVPLVVLVATLLVWQFIQKTQKRRKPLTTELLRQPAHGLRKSLDDSLLNISLYYALTIFLPGYFILVHVLHAWFQGRDSLLTGSAYIAIAVVASFVYCLRRFIKAISERNRLVNAVDAGIATAQELEILKSRQCRIFHDLQAGDFNIDHVVVGHGGIYSIETKSRMKPDTDNKKQDAAVEFDGKLLHFPGWKENKPVEQAIRQAKWLKSYIAKSTGESFDVCPVLSFPGWYVKQTVRSHLKAINPKVNDWMVPPKAKSVLDNSQIQKISFQLEKLALVDA